MYVGVKVTMSFLGCHEKNWAAYFTAARNVQGTYRMYLVMICLSLQGMQIFEILLGGGAGRMGGMK